MPPYIHLVSTVALIQLNLGKTGGSELRSYSSYPIKLSCSKSQ